MTNNDEIRTIAYELYQQKNLITFTRTRRMTKCHSGHLESILAGIYGQDRVVS